MIILRSIKKTTWKIALLLGNLNFSIFLLLLMAAISSLGTIIEQDKSVLFYELNYNKTNPILGFLTSENILLLGLDHVYKTFWFFSIIGLFGASLLSCTATRQIPSLKLSTLWHFLRQTKDNKKKGIKIEVKYGKLQKFSYILRKNGYITIQRGSFLYAYRGLIGKIAPIFVHISMIMILLGSISSTLTNSVSQDIIPKGYFFRPQNIISSGPLSYMPQDFEAHLDDFKISYTDQGTIDQFYSKVSIFDKNLKVKVEKVIFVNEPLKFSDLTFYQTDWGIGYVKVKTENKLKNIRVQNIISETNNKIWIGPLDVKRNLFVTLYDLTGNCPLYNKEGKLVGFVTPGSKVMLEGLENRIHEITPLSGIQTKSDSGISIIYTGFIVLIPSILFSYLSYSQIWGLKKGENLYIYAETNRALYYFEKFILEVKQTLQFKLND